MFSNTTFELICEVSIPGTSLEKIQVKVSGQYWPGEMCFAKLPEDVVGIPTMFRYVNHDKESEWISFDRHSTDRDKYRVAVHWIDLNTKELFKAGRESYKSHLRRLW